MTLGIAISFRFQQRRQPLAAAPEIFVDYESRYQTEASGGRRIASERKH
jgi:hypothetical protein